MHASSQTDDERGPYFFPSPPLLSVLPHGHCHRLSMPVHFFASAVSSAVPTEYWASIAASLVAISFLKTWSKGAKLLDPPKHSASSSTSPALPPVSLDALFNDLHGRVVLVASGAFTPLGVVTISSLAHRGAQIIALTPDISAPDVIQLIHLIRDSTQSELVYAEQCDLGSLESVSAFAALWNAGDKKEREGVRRLDAMLFLPPSRAELDRVQLADTKDKSKGKQRRCDAIYQLHVLARFHLVNSLLSSLLVLPPDREIRIISVLSPFYSAGLNHFDILTTSTPSKGAKPTIKSLSESSYSALIGAASLRWHALTSELQRRLDLLAEADPRPRTKLPGIDVHSAATQKTNAAASSSVQEKAATRMRQHSNISLLNVCPGFERNSDIIETFFPAKSASLIRNVLRYLLLLLIWPFVWLLSKSPATAAESVVWATTRKLESQAARYERILASLTSKSSQNEVREVRGWQDDLIPGEMYREGRIIRPQLPERFLNQAPGGDAWRQLWKEEEEEVERRIKALGGSIKRPKV